MPLTPPRVRASGRIVGLRAEDLDLAGTLQSGQVFRWSLDGDGAWRGTVGNRCLRLMSGERGDALYYEADGEDGEAFTRAFLRLDDFDLPAAGEAWSRADSLFAEAWTAHPGIRVLRQDPHECFFSFLCASVAPVARISRMVAAVAEEAGEPTGAGYLPYPPLCRLTDLAETRLRERGLGFRARRVVEVARALAARPEAALDALRLASHEEARAALTTFPGIGAKIADCVCLFSLDKDGAIPVDTHIWRLARARYAPELAGKSLTPANYARATRAFQERFGPFAGWAQQTLFLRAQSGGRV
jgi:N-glycosylase/DNA lyase